MLGVLVLLLLTSSVAAPLQERRPAGLSEPSAAVVEEIATVALDVRVETRAKTPARDITLALGVGLSGDAPRFTDRPVLAYAVSDEDGRARGEVPVPARWRDDPDAYLWARIETPGFPMRAQRRPLNRPSSAEPLLFRVGPGGTLAGRVLDPRGEPPAEGARVWLYADRDGEARGHSTTTDAQGRFAVDFAGSATFELHARAAGVGSAHLHGLMLSPGMDGSAAQLERSIELRVAGGRELAGRLVDPAGAPIVGMRLSAVAFPLDAFPGLAVCAAAERAQGGLFGDVARTDGEGSFRFPALMMAEYRLFGAINEPPPGEDGVGRSGPQLGDLLSQRTFVPGAAPATLDLRSTRLEITVVDHLGRAVANRPHFRRAPKDDRDAPVLDVSARADRAETSAPWLTPVFADGRVVIEVAPGSFLVSWLQLGVPYLEVPVTVEPGQFRVPVCLKLGAPCENAELTVEVPAAPRGAPPSTRKQVRVCSPGGWTVARSSDDGPFARIRGTWSTTLPPGRYRVVVEQEPDSSCVGQLPARSPEAPAQVEVELAPGEARTVAPR